MCLSLNKLTFTLYYGSLLNSVLCEAKDPHLVAPPRDSSEACDMAILFQTILLQQDWGIRQPCLLHGGLTSTSSYCSVISAPQLSTSF